MKVCPECGRASVNDEDRFCYLHGHELVEEDRHTCGRELSIHDKFCPKCGEKIYPNGFKPLEVKVTT